MCKIRIFIIIIHVHVVKYLFNNAKRCIAWHGIFAIKEFIFLSVQKHNFNPPNLFLFNFIVFFTFKINFKISKLKHVYSL